MALALARARRLLLQARLSSLFCSNAATASGNDPATSDPAPSELVKKKREGSSSESSTAARLIIAIKTAIREFRLGEIPRNAKLCGLPTERSLFTVIRGPHIDKKSREQYDIQTRKWHLTIDTRTSKLREKLDFLKEHRIPGVEIKAKFQYKTRLAWPLKPTGLSESDKWSIFMRRKEEPEVNTVGKLADEFGVGEQQVYDVLRIMEERKKHVDRFGVPGGSITSSSSSS